jgi:hypothetical protein
MKTDYDKDATKEVDHGENLINMFTLVITGCKKVLKKSGGVSKKRKIKEEIVKVKSSGLKCPQKS